MRSLWLGILGLVTSACSFIGATAEVGYTQMTLSGDVALASGAGGVPVAAEQDVGTVLGLGDGVGSPYARGQIDFGATVLTASLFAMSEQGSGTLTRSFGSLTAGSSITTDLDLLLAKASLTHDFGLGPVKVSPGLAVDLIDLGLRARESTFGVSDEIDELLPLPMLFCRAEGDLGLAAAVFEVGYLDLPEIDGFEASLLDLEAMLEYRLLPTVQLFTGYRRLDLDGHGETGSSSFAMDLVLDGWMIGGGMRF